MKMSDLIVIGAGIQGASAAYNLAKRGYGRILVLEQGAPDDLSGSTPRSASMIMQQTGNSRLSHLARQSYEILQSLEAELEIEIPFVETGSLLYGTDADGQDDSLSRRELRGLLTQQNELGIETDWIEHEDLPTVSQGMLTGPHVTFGIYCRADGFTDGTTIRNAYLSAFERLGGEVRFGARVADIETSGGSVQAVTLANGEVLPTGGVLNCAGIHADTVDGWIGAQLPLTVDRRFLAILERPVTVPQHFPIIEDHRHEWYFRPHQDGVLMGIGPTMTLDKSLLESADPELDQDSISLAKSYVERHIPSLAEAKIIESWAGRRPMICQRSPDNLADIMPRVGPVSSLEGMYQSAGWGAFGVTLAFVGGQLAAESICDGRLIIEVSG